MYEYVPLTYRAGDATASRVFIWVTINLYLQALCVVVITMKDNIYNNTLM